MKIIKDRKRNLADCLVITAGLIIVGIITKESVFYYVAASLGLILGLIPQLAYFISFVWQGIGIIMGFIVSKIVLTIIFYFFLFPFSLLQKLFSKNKAISSRKSESYWIIKPEHQTDFTKLW
ncbi:MAG TPA: hypothetical protein PLL66_09420 [Bacteroidales bacterium]|nr:hypothetical protein [Bacteroidales bacterium]